MNSSIYISSNNDAFNVDIPSFNAEAVSTNVEIPSAKPSEFDVVANKSITSFLALVVCIVIFLIFAFLYKKNKTEQPQYSQQLRRKIEQKVSVQENYENTSLVENKQSEQALYRHNSKKRSSLSTPTSVNKCIRAFLENTKEN